MKKQDSFPRRPSILSVFYMTFFPQAPLAHSLTTSLNFWPLTQKILNSTLDSKSLNLFQFYEMITYNFPTSDLPFKDLMLNNYNNITSLVSLLYENLHNMRISSSLNTFLKIFPNPSRQKLTIYLLPSMQNLLHFLLEWIN
jgi:hypothetical protein